MFRKIAYIGGIILIILICYSLAKQAYDSLQIDNRVDAETEKLLGLQRKNAELKNQLEQVNSVGFIESQARDRLNFSRAKETVVIISQEELQKVLGAAIEKKEEIKLPNWQGWLKLFWK